LSLPGASFLAEVEWSVRSSVYVSSAYLIKQLCSGLTLVSSDQRLVFLVLFVLL
jgi:hypothetical protein